LTNGEANRCILAGETTPPPRRAFFDFHENDKHIDEIAELIVNENGKPLLMLGEMTTP
jgi:hypothetical protein